MLVGSWIAGNINTASNANISDAIDLGREYSDILVQLGTCANTPAIRMRIKRPGGSFGPLHALTINSAGTQGSAVFTTGTMANHASVVIPIGGVKDVEVNFSTAQANGVRCYVCGVRP